MKTKPKRNLKLPNSARAIMGSRKERKESLARFLDANCKFCPTCNRAIVPDGAVRMTPMGRRILRLVERHGEIQSEVLHTALWGSDPNGGPSMKTLHVHVHQLNQMIAPYGLSVRAGRGRRDGYRLFAEAAE